MKKVNKYTRAGKDGKFIWCPKCLDNTPHKPAFGICQKCGTQYTTTVPNG